MALILALIISLAPTADTSNVRMTEDNPSWDCHEHGNRVCGRIGNFLVG